MTPRTTRNPAAAACVAALAAALVTGAAPVAVADTDDPALEQTVESGEAVVGDETVVTDGHIDIGPRFLDEEWTMLARDDREVPSVWRDPAGTVLHLGDAAVLPAPDSPDFEFLGVEPGTPLHVVPQTQAPDVVWLGWNTQDPAIRDVIDQGATLRLDAVDGPGDVFVFLQEGVAGPPNVLWDSGEPLPQELWMEVNTHVHANWVFTEPGTYQLDVTMLADLTDGTQAEDQSTLVFAVGADTDPDQALALAAGGADPAEEPSGQPSTEAESAPATASAPASATPEPNGPQADGASDGGSTLLWWAVPAGLLLALFLVLRAVRARRARAVADQDAEAER